MRGKWDMARPIIHDLSMQHQLQQQLQQQMEQQQQQQQQQLQQQQQQQQLQQQQQQHLQQQQQQQLQQQQLEQQQQQQLEQQQQQQLEQQQQQQLEQQQQQQLEQQQQQQLEQQQQQQLEQQQQQQLQQQQQQQQQLQQLQLQQHQQPQLQLQQQHQQPQQLTIDDERRQPLYLATTTPVWGIAERTVQEESMEEKNNDSGVSPDHYTSSPATSSFSPSSITSQDSTTMMQCHPFEYSPQNASPTEQPMEIVTTKDKPSSEESMSEELLMSEETVVTCPLCGVITNSRMQLSDHMSTHCAKKVDGEEFMRKVLEQLMNQKLQQPGTSASANQGKRPDQESKGVAEPGLRFPRVNSQGKVKLYRCKHCNHKAITKMEFWEHSRMHIRVEKMLSCPKCPFVTEYKHHLEYHLRNHFGSKPFKCELCNYTCVNKSMLNSHLKSHSNVYQYRCADCSYATKYCHSLKLHLRKYGHQPAMVLNADGSPNPLPIIDVYGTRRGPKQKPTKPRQQNNETGQSSTMTTNFMWQGLSTSTVTSPMVDNLPNTSMNGFNGIMNNLSATNNGTSAVNAANSMTNMNVMSTIGGLQGMQPVGGLDGIKPVLGLNGINPIGGLNGINPMGGLNEIVPNRQMLSFHYNQMLSKSSSSQFPVFTEFGNLQNAALLGYARAAANQEVPQNLVIKSKEASNANEMIYLPSEQTEVLNLEVKSVPLDLSKTSTIGTAQNKPASAITAKPTGTSRRKGIAVKLDRRVIQEDTDEELFRPAQLMQTVQQSLLSTAEQSSFNVAGCSGTSSNGQSSSGQGANGQSSGGPSFNGATEKDDKNPGGSTDCYCKFCEVGFANIMAYAAHMECHSFNDPYTCRLCNLKCPERVSFFLHIARSTHT